MVENFSTIFSHIELRNRIQISCKNTLLNEKKIIRVVPIELYYKHLNYNTNKYNNNKVIFLFRNNFFQ